MAFDPLIKTCVVSIGKGWGALGELATISITIRAVLPVTHIVWTATGDILTRNPDVLNVDGGAVPVVDQPGWATPAGEAFTGWSYECVASLRFKDGGSERIVKTIQPLSTSGPISLSLVHDGESASSPVITPTEPGAVVDYDFASIITA